MSNKKISELPVSTNVDDADVLPIVDTSENITKQVTAAQLRAYFTKDTVQIANNEYTDQSGYVLVGAFGLDAYQYSDVKFISTANVTNVALSGIVQFYNLTDAVEVTSHMYTSTSPSTTTSSSLVLPQEFKIYEVRILVTGSTSPSDQIILGWAGLVLIG